jgi:hypothetical protein
MHALKNTDQNKQTPRVDRVWRLDFTEAEAVANLLKEKIAGNESGVFARLFLSLFLSLRVELFALAL